MLGLLVIDVQQAMFGTAEPHDGRAVLGRIAELIGRARAVQAPLFFVQHDGGPGDAFDKNGPGFAYMPEVAPLPSEPVTVKRRTSAFYETGLDLSLRAAGIDALVICGLQTEYCVDTTVRSAFERGYRVTVVGDGHSTFDSALLPATTIIAHTQHLWNGRFARLKRAADVVFDR
ncbi:MAG: cysteine hydrolase family protein [Rhizomicrobium sp.]|nr:cysteine hydrolase family protein [Rhizomicrobium sp.]